jgi:MFS family permease
MVHITQQSSRRALIAIAASNFLLLLVASGTGSLWPVYITQLGGGPTASGIFNAAGWLTGFAGILCSGWLADHTGRRKTIFYVSCLLFTSTWWLMTGATTWQQATLINLAAGFTFASIQTMIIILTGLLASETERGRSFGMLTLTAGISQLLGGLVGGPVADRFGFNTLFMADTLFCLGCMLPWLFFTEPRAAAPTGAPVAGIDAQSTEKGRGWGGLGRRFYAIVAASLLLGLTNMSAGLGRSITMNQLGFSATAISLAAAIAGAVTLPAPLALGWLSDRIGRRRLLLGCLAAGLTALLALAFARSAWSFWGASILLALLTSASPLLQALATDLLPARTVGSGLSLLSSASAVGFFVSALGIGAAIEGLGSRPAFLITALAPLLAMGLVARARKNGHA